MPSTDDAALRELIDSLVQPEGFRVADLEVDRVESTFGGIRFGCVVQLATAGTGPEPADAVSREQYVFVEDVTDEDDPTQPGPAPILVEGETGERLRVWVHPNDPWLPALPAATVPSAVELLLARLGRPGTVLDLEIVSYRPGRRGVMRVVTPEGTSYLKVVRPHKAEALRRVHGAFLSAGLPVPVVEAFSPDGLMLIGELAGPTAGSLLGSLVDEPRFLDELEGLTERIRGVSLAVESRRGAAERPGWYLDSLARLLPHETERLEALRTAILARPLPADDAVRHGDLHLEQLIVDPDEPWRITGLLDIDTAGRGRGGTELACGAAELERRWLGDGDETAGAMAARISARFGPGDPDWNRALACHLVAHAVAPAADPAEHAVAVRLLDRASWLVDA